MIGRITEVFQNNKASPIYATTIGQVVNGKLVVWWEGLVEIPLGVTSLILPMGVTISTVADSDTVDNNSILSVPTSMASIVAKSGLTSISAYVAVSPIPTITIRRIAWTKGTFMSSPTSTIPPSYADADDHDNHASVNVVQLANAIIGDSEPCTSGNVNVLNTSEAIEGTGNVRKAHTSNVLNYTDGDIGTGNVRKAHTSNVLNYTDGDIGTGNVRKAHTSNVLNYTDGDIGTGNVHVSELIQNGMQKASGKVIDGLLAEHNGITSIPSLHKPNIASNVLTLTDHNIESTVTKVDPNIVDSDIVNTVNYPETLAITIPTTTKLLLKTGLACISCAIANAVVATKEIVVDTIDTALVTEIDTTSVADLDNILIT